MFPYSLVVLLEQLQRVLQALRTAAVAVATSTATATATATITITTVATSTTTTLLRIMSKLI